jgi:hypothetical protein
VGGRRAGDRALRSQPSIAACAPGGRRFTMLPAYTAFTAMPRGAVAAA